MAGIHTEKEATDMTTITASIYRTCPKQIAEKGATAWAGMNFNAGHTSMEAVRSYCEQLASGDGIIEPRIEIKES